VEVMFQLRNPVLCNQVVTEVIEPYLADTEKTRILLEDGTYVRASDPRAHKASQNGFHFNVQEFLIGFAEGRDGLDEVPSGSRFFKIPTVMRRGMNQKAPAGRKSK
jgi:hypothetical protein